MNGPLFFAFLIFIFLIYCFIFPHAQYVKDINNKKSKLITVPARSKVPIQQNQIISYPDKPRLNRQLRPDDFGLAGTSFPYSSYTNTMKNLVDEQHDYNFSLYDTPASSGNKDWISNRRRAYLSEMDKNTDKEENENERKPYKSSKIFWSKRTANESTMVEEARKPTIAPALVPKKEPKKVVEEKKDTTNTAAKVEAPKTSKSGFTLPPPPKNQGSGSLFKFDFKM